MDVYPSTSPEGEAHIFHLVRAGQEAGSSQRDPARLQDSLAMEPLTDMVQSLNRLPSIYFGVCRPAHKGGGGWGEGGSILGPSCSWRPAINVCLVYDMS